MRMQVSPGATYKQRAISDSPSVRPKAAPVCDGCGRWRVAVGVWGRGDMRSRASRRSRDPRRRVPVRFYVRS